MNLQKHGGPSTDQLGGPTTEHHGDRSSHIQPREPIIDKDYKLNEDDHDATAFIQMSYEDTEVVKIGNMVVRAKQLLGNVKNEFIGDEVLSFQIHFDNTNIQTHMY